MTSALPTDYRYLDKKPQCLARIRQQASDFQVTEIPSFVPDGEGEHHFLRIRKTGENTDWVARQLAKFCQVSPREVGYAGKKDRHAVTEQWFSVRLGHSKQLNWKLFDSETYQVLEATRHSRKLRLGALAGNRFSLVLRDVSDADALLAQVELAKSGVPNYFGEQRFGREGGNLERGIALLKGEFEERQRHKKGLYISAVRSWVFNHLLSERIEQQLWHRPLDGEALMLSGSRSFFVAPQWDEELEQRWSSGDIGPSAPLWGRGALQSERQAAEWEKQQLAAFAEITERLEYVGLQQERRALKLVPQGLSAEQLEDGNWRLQFSLPAGCFATSVLRELCQLRED